jgi:RNA polymerase sigma-70 factor (ECF subfamily)
MAERCLIAAAREGHRPALETIVADHQAAVYGYLRSRLLEPADAEDLCQEVFLRWYGGKAACEAGIRLRPWLIGVARNLLREHVRRVKRRKEVGWTELCLGLEELIGDASSEPFDEAMVHLPACLDALGQSARAALEMRYQAQRRLGEIGQKLRRSEGAVKLLMFRARQALRMCLESKIGAGSDE